MVRRLSLGLFSLVLMASKAQAMPFACTAVGFVYWYQIAGSAEGEDGKVSALNNAAVSVGRVSETAPFFVSPLTLAHQDPYIKYSAPLSVGKLSVTLGDDGVVKVWHEEFGAAMGARSYRCHY